MFSGKKPPAKPSGGNLQREKFRGGLDGVPGKSGGKDRTETPIKSSEVGEGEDTSTITHHPDGSHTIKHADGEESKHPNMAHAAMQLHAKHESGPAMHVHDTGEGARTHHVGHDGMVEGPHEHGSVDEAADHMKQVMGEGGGNGAIEMSEEHPPGMNMY